MKNCVKGFTCKCGEYHEYPSYVYAHWGLELILKCTECGLKYIILKGIAVREVD